MSRNRRLSVVLPLDEQPLIPTTMAFRALAIADCRCSYLTDDDIDMKVD
jgi:hypothetical protein